MAASRPGSTTPSPVSLRGEVELARAAVAIDQADAAIERFIEARQEDIVDSMPMPPHNLIQQLEVHRREQLLQLQVDVREPAARAIAMQRLNRHVNFDIELLKVVNERAIAIAADAASDLGWFGLNAVVRALEAHGEAVTEADFIRVRDDALLTFDGLYDGVLSETPEFIEARQTLVRRATALWRQVQQQAEEMAAMVQNQDAEVAARPRGPDGQPRGRVRGQGLARFLRMGLIRSPRSLFSPRSSQPPAHKERDGERSPRTHSSASGDERRSSAGGSVSSGASPASYSTAASNSSSNSSNGYYTGALGRQPAGTTNSKGSKSLGNGYTVDRNGRYHGPDGKFVSKEVTRIARCA